MLSSQITLLVGDPPLQLDDLMRHAETVMRPIWCVASKQTPLSTESLTDHVLYSRLETPHSEVHDAVSKRRTKQRLTGSGRMHSIGRAGCSSHACTYMYTYSPVERRMRSPTQPPVFHPTPKVLVFHSPPSDCTSHTLPSTSPHTEAPIQTVSPYAIPIRRPGGP